MDWKKIEDYDYSINQNGEIRNDLTEKNLKGWINSKGYHEVEIRKNGKSKYFKIHRLLYKYFKDDYKEELFVDHIDRNRLNNSLDNLRMVTPQQNCCNINFYKNTSSKYKGVHFNKSIKKWIARIQINKKQIHLGCYKTEEEAAKVYNKYIDDNNLEYYSKNIF